MDANKACKLKHNGGSPIKHQITGENLFCGISGAKCPLASRCIVHETDAYAVCCLGNVQLTYRQR